MNIGRIAIFSIITIFGMIIVSYIIDISSILNKKKDNDLEKSEKLLNRLNDNKGIVVLGLIISLVGIIGILLNII